MSSTTSSIGDYHRSVHADVCGRVRMITMDVGASRAAELISDALYDAERLPDPSVLVFTPEGYAGRAYVLVVALTQRTYGHAAAHAACVADVQREGETGAVVLAVPGGHGAARPVVATAASRAADRLAVGPRDTRTRTRVSARDAREGVGTFGGPDGDAPAGHWAACRSCTGYAHTGPCVRPARTDA